jgi:DnaJ-domain-containing protein 1
MKNYFMRIMGAVSIMAVMPSMILADPTFSLKNKSINEIQVSINNSAKRANVADNATMEEKDLVVNNISSISIHYCPSSSACKAGKVDYLEVSFKPGDYKTMYLKFSIKDGKGHLEPQKGSANKTTDGYSLSKNIKAKNIVGQKVTKGEMGKASTGIKRSSGNSILEQARARNPILEQAWAQFPEANELRSHELEKNISANSFAMPVWYAVLGLKKSATKDEIQKAYIKLSRKWHPDKHSSGSDADQAIATQVFTIINEAKKYVEPLLLEGAKK